MYIVTGEKNGVSEPPVEFSFWKDAEEFARYHHKRGYEVAIEKIRPRDYRRRVAKEKQK